MSTALDAIQAMLGEALKPPVLRYPNPRLTAPSLPVQGWTDDLAGLIHEMGQAMIAHEAVGLAAPQVGRLLRVVVLRAKNNAVIPLVNPRIVERSTEMERDFEACLSLPGLRAPVSRHAWVVVEYDAPFRVVRERIAGFPARVVQHEIDHLDGVLLWDRAGDLAKRLLQKAYGHKLKHWRIAEAKRAAMERRTARFVAGETVTLHEPTNAAGPW